MLKFLERARGRLFSSAATGFIAALAMGGTVAAITDSTFTYSSTKTGYYPIHPMDLSPDGNDTANNYLNNFTEANLSAAGAGCFSTGVNLPQGSRITQLAVWYTSEAGSNPSAHLFRNALTAGSTTQLQAGPQTFPESATRKLKIFPILGGSSLVSNAVFSYGFGFCVEGADSFRGARVDYTYTSAGD